MIKFKRNAMGVTMADCNLSIHLDEPLRVYRSGERVTGRVQVQTTDKLKCKKLEIATIWQTHGWGNVDRGNGDECDPFNGEWPAGVCENYPFELIVADGPPTYHGQYVSVDHFVSVQIHVPWAFDIKAREPFLFQPSGPASGSTNRSAQQAIDVDAKRKSAGMSLGGYTTIIAGIFGVMVILGVAFPPTLFFIVPIGLVILLYSLLKHWLPWWVLGETQWHLTSEQITPGDSADFSIRFHPHKPVQIESISLTLTAKERVTKGSGSNRRTKTETIYEQTETAVGRTKLMPRGDTGFTLPVKIPSDAPLSFDLNNNDLLWEADVRVAIDRWPDWTRKVSLQVVPGNSIATGMQDAETTRTQPASIGSPPAIQTTVSSSSGGREDPDKPPMYFGQFVSEVAAKRGDQEQLQKYVEEHLGATFTATASLDRRLLYLGEEQEQIERGESAWWAEAGSDPVGLTLYVNEQTSSNWRIKQPELVTGKVILVGYSTGADRVRLRWLADV